MKKDPFEEYIKQTEPEKRELGYAWYTAIGLQAVDGLSTSKYLKDTAKENIEGKITLKEAERLIEGYYEEASERDVDRRREADIVSARIAAILSENAFTFSVPQYIGIHRRLFHGIYLHAGKIRNYNISKKEWILDGESVHYGNSLEIRELLEYDIRMEKEYAYQLIDMKEIIQHLAKFISGLWQIHAFEEGNTRTTAVFFIQYLRTIGFDVTNDIFAEHAWYFRNALVRADYNDFSKDIRETTEYLESFLRNLLLDESNELKNRYMHVRWREKKQDIEEKKQDIQSEKQDVEEKKQDIQSEKQDIEEKKQNLVLTEKLSNKTRQHITDLFLKFGYEKFFGRTEVMNILGITASPASMLIKRMLELQLIYPMKGKGKGKYLFRRESIG
ncbi:MAG: Fic family protein [Lachnospiraceae bacterium]|nr:Fic family protein [Lachnospiraceae bacterium]